MTGLTLSGFSSTANFAENDVNAGPQLLLGDVTFTAPGTLEGATLVVSGLLAEDVVGLRDAGVGFGDISLLGTQVRYRGLVIGTVSGGQGTDLTVSFNADATAAGVEAVFENLTYANASDAPTALRGLAFSLTDRNGLQMVDNTAPVFSAPVSPVLVAADFSADLYAPAMADLNGDGALDMVVGTDSGALRTYLNVNGTFVEQTGTDNPFDAITLTHHSLPTFVDFDHDGDMDLVDGTQGNGLRSFRNDGTGFTELTGGDNPFGSVATGVTISAPAFADLDGDGDLDLVVGAYEGTIQTYRNDGASGWTELTGAANPFAALIGDGNTGVGQVASPTFLDADGDGDLDLVVGTFLGTLALYANQGDGTYAQVTGAANPFDGMVINYLARPLAVDLDGDGDKDLVVGNAFTGVTAIMNLTPQSFVMTVSVAQGNDAPQVTGLPATLAGYEDLPGAVDLSGLDIADPDGAGEMIALSITASEGHLAAKSAGGVMVLLQGGATLVAYGTAAGLEAWLANANRITFTGETDHFGTVTLSVTASDGTDDLAAGTINLEIADIPDTRMGGPGPDVIIGDAGVDVLVGRDGRDRLFGLGGDDALYGGSEADTLRGGLGADVLYGGTGSDMLDYGLSLRAVSVDLRVGSSGLQSATGGEATGDLIAEFENVTGGRGNDTVIGDAQGNQLIGNAGRDLLDGGDGNDLIRGGAGADTMDGGAGVDTLDYSTSVAAVTVILDADPIGLAIVFGGDAQGDVASHFENVRGSAFDDVINAGAGANALFGMDGADTLNGGLGRDTLTGGDGADVFFFSSKLGLGNIDRVTDFVAGEDQLMLDLDFFRGLTAGPLAPEAFRVNATGLAEDADDRVIYDETTGTLVFDRDGTGAAGGIKFAVLTAHLALTEADFFVV